MKRKRRKKNKGRKARLRKMNLYENKNATHRENEQMLKRLNRRKPMISEAEKNKKLAQLAGIDIPQSTSGFNRRNDRNDRNNRNDRKDKKSRLKVGGMESSSGKRSRILLSRSKSKSPKRRRNKSNSSSPKRWRHDKFDKFNDAANTPEKEEAFGSHWSQIRSERSKERDRQSKSRSRSSRSRSSRSRSRSNKRRSRYSSSSSGMYNFFLQFTQVEVRSS